MEEKQITRKWYEVKVQYQKAMEDGLEKKVTETYCFDALSFTEAEESAISHLMSMAPDLDVTGIQIAKYKEAFLGGEAQRYYKVTVKICTVDEKTGKEKKTPVVHLVQAETTAEAEKRTRAVYGMGMQNYEISDINESKVLELFLHGTSGDAEGTAAGKEDEL